MAFERVCSTHQAQQHQRSDQHTIHCACAMKEGPSPAGGGRTLMRMSVDRSGY